jgi:peptide/nickel transport system permease protein
VLRFILRRLMLAFVTLAFLLVIVTLIPNIAPGDPARKMQVTESLGLRDSVLTQLQKLATSVFTLDFGDSFSVAAGEPVMSLVWSALGNSAKLVILALIVIVPLSVLGGLVTAYKKDTWIDRTIINVGIAFSAIPDFVAGVFLLAFLAVPVDFFKVQAAAPPGSSPLVQIQHLLLPVIAVLMVYFGYIARVTRAGTITALDSDYARTAFMRGLSIPQVFRKHIARNALQPTVAVLGTQLGYLFGGMVALERVFGYQGVGNLILRAVDRADYPVLRAGVLAVAVIYMLATLSADLLIAYMNPRARQSLGDN